MNKGRIAAAVAAAVSVGMGVLAQAAPAFAAGYSGADASAFVADINALRASHGLGSLSVSSSLVSMADNWSVHLAGAGSLSHNPNLAGQAPTGWRLLGENVGVGPDVATLQSAFTNSPEHYANMVDPRFTQIGVAVYVSSQGYLWVTEDYMEPPAAAAAPAPVVSAPRTSPAPAPAPVVVRPVVATSPAPAPVPVHASPATPAPTPATVPPAPAPVHPAASAAAPVATPTPATTPASPALRAKPAPAPHQTHRTAAVQPAHRSVSAPSGLGAVLPAVSRYASQTRDVALVLVPLAALAWVLPRRRLGLSHRGPISTV
ncbi:MAG TPA: CAP domain-containing protein [Acidimicrobiales bacterium]|nr:CAP domain-containing protein [Acidimicrobiales bacterium]